jgi:hypothetical protein
MVNNNLTFFIFLNCVRFASGFNSFTHTIALGYQFLSSPFGAALGMNNAAPARPVPNATVLAPPGIFVIGLNAGCVCAVGEVTVVDFGAFIGGGVVDFGAQGDAVDGAFVGAFVGGVTGLRGAGAGLGALGLTFGISGQGSVFGLYGLNGFVFGPSGFTSGLAGVVVVPTLGGIAASGTPLRGRK